MTDKSRSWRSKQRILRLLRYLYENTDEEHPAKTGELAEALCGENTQAARRMILADIQILEGEGYDIETVKSYYHAFYLRNREFELPELKLLIDAVSSSRFVTRAKSEELVQKLSGMASRHQAEKLVRHIYTAERLKPGNENIYYIVDLITDAINEDKKVTFQYFDYTAAKQKTLRHDGAYYSVSPYALLWDDNHYYMIGYSDSREAINVYRVDRMNALGVKEEPAVPKPDDFDVDAYGQESVNMFFGKKQEVILQCENDAMKSVIDQFGEEIETWVVDKAFFRAKVTVNVSQTFFAWVFQFRGRVRIYGPDDVVKEYKEMLEKTILLLSV